MSVAAGRVRLDFDDYVAYTEAHADGAFELVDGVIFSLAPEADRHLRTRAAIDWYLKRTLDLYRYAPWTEASLPAPGWFDGPRPLGRPRAKSRSLSKFRRRRAAKT